MKKKVSKISIILIGIFILIIATIASKFLISVIDATKMLDEGSEQMSSLSDTLKNQIIVTYDNKTFTGAMVNLYISNLINNDDLIIVINNISGSSTNVIKANTNLISCSEYTFEIKSINDTVEVDEIKVNNYIAGVEDLSTNGKYAIDSSSQYASKLVMNNDEVIGVIFLKI